MTVFVAAVYPAIPRAILCTSDKRRYSVIAYGKVEICGVDTSRLPVLTQARMLALFPLVHAGDKAARDEFVQGNLRLVLSVIQRFAQRGENADDLFQVGCIGLMKAIDNFDVSQNVRFSTYAVPMIIGEIRRYLRDNNAIRVSRSMRDTAYKSLQARDKLQAQLGREPTVAEIAEEMQEAKKAIFLLGGSVETQVEMQLPDSNIYRNLFVIKKNAATPKKYPRKAGLPAKEPLK